LKQPDVLARLAADGTDAVGSTPAQFGAHMQSERVKWIKAIKDSGITIQ
jgi:tripartite-type tricarboxylate transporter receptor subunit TctC